MGQSIKMFSPASVYWVPRVAGMKTVELTPSLSRTNFHAFSSSLVPFLIFFISTAGTGKVNQLQK